MGEITEGDGLGVGVGEEQAASLGTGKSPDANPRTSVFSADLIELADTIEPLRNDASTDWTSLRGPSKLTTILVGWVSSDGSNGSRYRILPLGTST